MSTCMSMIRSFIADTFWLIYDPCHVLPARSEALTICHGFEYIGLAASWLALSAPALVGTCQLCGSQPVPIGCPANLSRVGGARRYGAVEHDCLLGLPCSWRSPRLRSAPVTVCRRSTMPTTDNLRHVKSLSNRVACTCNNYGKVSIM